MVYKLQNKLIEHRNQENRHQQKNVHWPRNTQRRIWTNLFIWVTSFRGPGCCSEKRSSRLGCPLAVPLTMLPQRGWRQEPGKWSDMQSPRRGDANGSSCTDPLPRTASVVCPNCEGPGEHSLHRGPETEGSHPWEGACRQVLSHTALSSEIGDWLASKVSHISFCFSSDLDQHLRFRETVLRGREHGQAARHVFCANKASAGPSLHRCQFPNPRMCVVHHCGLDHYPFRHIECSAILEQAVREFLSMGRRNPNGGVGENFYSCV
ncbi:uncharacterized protein LOC122215182 [Panthera leo]|uniref:uncharacterized protein LOC122215182 n=1 Tax=Panthera leo TaxID=9689 RepID=UPI001C6A0D47|nr:uncharacterized protein LOC122215182 [Panthera leo]